MSEQEEDPWDFLAQGTKEPGAPLTRRAAGEFRAEMGNGPSLKSKALPLALSLAAISVAGFLTETVAASQILALAGPKALLIVYPIGGIGLIVFAVLQFKFVDSKARLRVLRVIGLAYAIVFALALALVAGSFIPVVATALIWVLADQLNFLLPLLMWSLAGDEFNVAEARKIYPWIISWVYGGQVLGLAIATVSPPVLDNFNIGLPALLVINPLVCIFVAIWLPRRLKGSFASRGTGKNEDLGEALKGAREFINGVPVWRSLLIASTITFIAAMTAFIGFLSGTEEIIGTDAGRLQSVIGAMYLVSFCICWLVQTFVAERIQEKIGIPGVLLILPIATVGAGISLTVGILTQSLWLLALGLALWFIPRWSLDENARRSALALVPDERRARVSFIIDLFPIAIGLIAAGFIAAIGLLVDITWLVPASASLIALAAIPYYLKVYQGWDASLLNWRLRRRKQNRVLGLDFDNTTEGN